MYYKAFLSEDQKLTGKSPQVSRMNDHYPLLDFNSIWQCSVLGKIEMNPNLDYFETHYHSKLTDILKTENLLGANNYLVSPKTIEILQQHKLPCHQIFPAKVMHHKKNTIII